MEGNEERHLSVRLESLSDMVFGLALSIGALLLAISNIGTPAQIESNILTFGFSFLILIFVWTRYTAILSDMPPQLRQKGYVIWLGAGILFLVAIEPYLYDILHTATSAAVLGFASSAYAIDIGLIMSIISVFITLLIRADMRSNRRMTLPRKYLYIRAGSISIAAIMFISAVPIFWQLQVLGIPARFAMWIVIIPLMALGRLIKGIGKEKAHRARMS